jgi:hypothetical protein
MAPAAGESLPAEAGARPPPASPPGHTVDRRLLAGLALVTAVLAVYQQRQTDPDLWGHLRYGRFFAKHGPRATTDPFAYTSAGLTWQAHEWLAQWLLWEAYDRGGPLGLILFKCLVGGAAVYFLYRALRLASSDARVWAPVLMLAASMVGRWFLFRPQLFTFCFFAYFVFILHGHLRGRRAGLWTLPVVLALWANLHGGFLAGLGAIGLALVLRGAQVVRSDGRKAGPLWAGVWPLSLTLMAGLAATLLTPSGLGLWRYVLTEMTHQTNRLYIDEWMPLLRFPRHAWTALTVFLLLGVLLVAGLFAWRRPGRVAGVPAWLWLLSCVPLTWMAFSSVRHVPLLVLWTAPIVALLADGAVAVRAESRPWQTAWLAVTGLVGLPTLLAVYFTLADPRPRITLGPVPGRAVAFLRINGLHGNVYAPLEWGSYLTWELYPEVRVAMDGRNVTLFPSAQVKENLTYYLLDDADPSIPLRYPTDYLLVPPAAAVLKALRHDSHWQELSTGADAVVFVRADGRHDDVLRRYRAGALEQPHAGDIANPFLR